MGVTQERNWWCKMVSSLRQQILDIAQKRPNTNSAEVARLLGVSRERIRQLRHAMGLPTKYPKPLQTHKCKKCDNQISMRRLYCGQPCRYGSEKGTVQCTYCNELFLREQRYITRAKKNGRIISFCCKQHHGKWLGAIRTKQWKKIKKECAAH